MDDQNTGPSLEQLQAHIREVLKNALDIKIVSQSPHQGTGNAYQSVRFGDEKRKGFRAERVNLFAGFVIADRSVCDLGANLGEIARDLRRRKAAKVDAYEYDGFFTQIARYISAFNGVANINHYQADVSQKGFMHDRYDLCVGLSAFSYMSLNIDYICSQTNEDILIETHSVSDSSWGRRYVAPIIATFPHWCCFGVVAHSERPKQREGKRDNMRRLWLTFSKESLIKFYARRAREIDPNSEGVIKFDLANSELNYTQQVQYLFDADRDVLSDASIADVRSRIAAYEDRLKQGETINLSMSGEIYWLALVSGMAAFLKEGAFSEDGDYHRWWVRGLESGTIDPGLRPLLKEPAKLAKKGTLRLRALAEALKTRNVDQFQGLPIAYNATPAHPDLEALHLKTFKVANSDERLCVPRLDGHHRLFVMKLLNVRECPMMSIWDVTLLQQPQSLARVTNYEKRILQYVGGEAVEPPQIASAAASGA